MSVGVCDIQNFLLVAWFPSKTLFHFHYGKYELYLIVGSDLVLPFSVTMPSYRICIIFPVCGRHCGVVSTISLSLNPSCIVQIALLHLHKYLNRFKYTKHNG